MFPNFASKQSTYYLKILDISAFYHDSAVAIVGDDQIIAAAQVERFTRIKHDESFPTNATEYCLKGANCSLEEISKEQKSIGFLKELLLMLKHNKK